MNKIILTLALAGLAFGLQAQNYEVPLKNGVITNGFWSNWFVSGGVNFNAAYTSEEQLSNKNPFSSDRGTFGFDLSLGKWFTPGIGLRTKFEGLWSKQVINAQRHDAYRFWHLHEDVLFNLSNLLYGYNEDRVWNFIPYVGLGVARNLSYDRNEIVYNLGILNNFRISRHWSAFVDLHARAMDGSFDAAPVDVWSSHERFSIRHFDKMLGLSIGVTYHIGKSKWDKAPDLETVMMMNQEQLNALNASLHDQQMENDRLRRMLEDKEEAEQPTPGPAPQTDPADSTLGSVSHSLFFHLGNTQLVNRRDLVDLKSLVEWANANKRQLVVRGYADSKTGSVDYNQQLSEARAQAVAEELVKMGCPRERLVIEAKGGVDELAPFSYNRRVVVSLK